MNARLATITAQFHHCLQVFIVSCLNGYESSSLIVPSLCKPDRDRLVPLVTRRGSGYFRPGLADFRQGDGLPSRRLASPFSLARLGKILARLCSFVSHRFQFEQRQACCRNHAVLLLLWNFLPLRTPFAAFA